MPHILSKLTDVSFDDVRRTLQEHAPAHLEQGMVLEYLWRDVDKPGDVLFLFRVDDLDRAMQRMKQIHADARRADPDAKIPETTYLAD